MGMFSSIVFSCEKCGCYNRIQTVGGDNCSSYFSDNRDITSEMIDNLYKTEFICEDCGTEHKIKKSISVFASVECE